MQLTFIETRLFSQLQTRYLSDEAYSSLQQLLLNNPHCGVVIPGTSGLRKLRWEDKRRNTGKCGGLRVIYYYLTADNQIWLLTLYNKDEVTDLSMRERKLLTDAVRQALTEREKQS